jgi:hypothetical protein
VDLFLPLKEGKKSGSGKTYTTIYAAAPLTISLRSANSIANGKPLNSSPSSLTGTPHVIIEDNAVPIEVKSGKEAAWLLTVDTANLKQLQDAIAALFLVCHYSVN